MLSLMALLLSAPAMLGQTRLVLGDPPGPVVRDQLFAIPVYVDTDGQPVVVLDLLLNYPPQGLTILGMDTAGSAFSTMHFDNPLLVMIQPDNGVAEIVCGIPTPGVSGDDLLAGYLILQSGSTPGIMDLTPVFSSPGSVGNCHMVVDDGQGTDILAGVTGVSVDISDETSHALYFAHFVEGEGYETTFTIINAHPDTAANGVLALRDATGDPLAYALNGDRRKGFAVFGLGPQQAMRWTSSGDGGLQSGAGLVSANQAVGGMILFDSPGGTAGVGATTPVKSLMAPIQRSVSGGVNSGVALYNPDDESHVFTLTIHTPDGGVADEAEFEIPARGQLVRFVDGLFPEYDTSEFFGSISFTDDFRLAGMVIRTGQDNNGSFATMPVISDGMDELHFAQFADGSGIRSTIILLNPSSTDTTQGTVFINDERGEPLSVDLNGTPTTGSHLFTIPPRGGVTLATDGAGELVAGNVLVTADGPIGGTILFSGAEGTAGVGDSRPVFRFLVPVEKSTARGVNSGLSVVNPETAEIQMQFDLLDMDGQLLAQSAAVSVPAGGQYVRFLTEIFPEFIFPDDFEGMIRLDSAAQVAAMALRTGQQSYATLPVVPLD
jgi:hypothetical protein